VARLLVQLKLRLLRNALRASTGATFATLLLPEPGQIAIRSKL
jgi:hypothetical protein